MGRGRRRIKMGIRIWGLDARCLHKNEAWMNTELQHVEKNILILPRNCYARVRHHRENRFTDPDQQAAKSWHAAYISLSPSSACWDAAAWFLKITLRVLEYGTAQYGSM
jgi:hypothetical protein